MVCLNQDGESLIDNLTILVGARTGRHVFNREVHSGSKFQDILLFLKLTLNNNGGQMLMLSSGGADGHKQMEKPTCHPKPPPTCNTEAYILLV